MCFVLSYSSAPGIDARFAPLPGLPDNASITVLSRAALNFIGSTDDQEMDVRTVTVYSATPRQGLRTHVTFKDLCDYALAEINLAEAA